MPKRINPETGRGYTFKDRMGLRNGRLVVTGLVGKNKHGAQVWEAKCDCGNVTRTIAPHKTLSCGCLQREAIAKIQRAKRRLSDGERLCNAKENALRQRQRRRVDPVAAMHARISRLHRWAIAKVGAIKKSPTLDALGYTASELVSHIERQFSSGMGWHNMDKWQIDHILPISLAKTELDVIALNQLSNLRPMWAGENNKKHARRANLL